MKRWIRLGAIVVVIAAMVVALIVLRSPSEPAGAPGTAGEPSTFTENPDRITLLENPRNEIARVTVSTDESEIAFVREDDNRFLPVYEYDVAFDLQRVSRIVSGAASLTSRRVIGEVDDLSEYGLAEPQASITVERDSGETQRILVGDQTPARDAFYVQRPDDPVVYTVFGSWINPFFTTLDALRVRAIPQVSFETLERIRVDTLTGRTIRVEKIPEWDEDPELGFSVFAVTEPFTRRFQVNTNWLEELNTNLTELRIGTFVDDAPLNLERYGLATPEARVLVADEQTTLELLVGLETEGGRFAKFPDSPSVFVLSGIERIVAVRPYDTISAFALIINIDLVDSFVVEAPEATYRGDIERTEVEGEEEPEETYVLNGEPITEDLFKDLYQWAIGMQFDAEIPAADLPSSAAIRTREPLATITYSLNNDMGPLSISFVPQNANFAAVVRDGESQFMIARAKIQRMLEAFEAAAAEL
ncbi:MAG TPA: DUF4340 domain-containing protein [Spirochaetia bacterium]|nr:DUF4340 domain-containing protein [Spirochaetia bacterium]